MLWYVTYPHPGSNEYYLGWSKTLPQRTLFQCAERPRESRVQRLAGRGYRPRLNLGR
jgi:hypothetical protein